MAKVQDQLAQVGMGTLVAGLKAVEQGVSKKQFKRLIATAVAQLLTMHPDFGTGKAIRRARKIVGAKPAKKMVVKPGKVGVKQGIETVAAAAATGAAMKVASKVGRKLTEKVGVGASASDGGGRRDDRANGSPTRDS
jgi:hypothetical protein